MNPTYKIEFANSNVSFISICSIPEQNMLSTFADKLISTFSDKIIISEKMLIKKQMIKMNSVQILKSNN